MKIPFNKPFIVGREMEYIEQAVSVGNIGADGMFTRRCASMLKTRFGIGEVLMTCSGTAALEMAAILCDLHPGDEVIMPSFTFVSTANAVVRTGARPRFVDIRSDTLNLDEEAVERAINAHTKAIFPVHYAGVGCEMDRLAELALDHKLLLVEDAAQGVNAFYRHRPLGTLGDLAVFSFHETKNYICGEGGACCVNRPELVERANILRDKGTNRQRFLRGDVDRYSWVDEGGSYVPSEILCAFLCAQLEAMDRITERRRDIYKRYDQGFQTLADAGLLSTPAVPQHCQSNWHLFYLLLNNAAQRDALMKHLQERGIHAVIHYVPLHSSTMGRRLGCSTAHLPVTDSVAARLLRLPFFYEMEPDEQQFVIDEVSAFLDRRG